MPVDYGPPMKRLLAGLLTVFVLVSAGCKNGSEPTETSTTTTTSPEPTSQPTVAHAASEPASPAPDRSGRSTRGFDAADCRKLCPMVGKCQFKDGKCLAGSDADCEPSIGCQLMGACYAEEGRCIARSDADCEKSRECAARGACFLVDGSCRNSSPMSDAEKAAAKTGTPTPPATP